LAHNRRNPWVSEEDKLRLYDAFSEVVQVALRFVTVAVTEDLQFIDAASLEISLYMTSKWTATGGPCRFINSFRASELSPEMTAGLQHLVESDLGILIQLEPLNAENVGEMLVDLVPNGLSLTHQTDLVVALHRFTGGNPLFVLETGRSLAERGGLETLTVEQFENRRRVAGLPRTPKVQTIIQRRFERLSAPARDLAQVAAVAGEYFTLELGAKVLETPILKLSRAAVELETAHVWRGLRFSHDCGELLEAKILELYGQNGDLEKSREARNCALKVIESLARKITDETMRDSFISFAQSNLRSAQAQRTT
jgi:predicted ATPase